MCEGTENRKNGNEKRRKRDRNWYDRTFKELHERELLLKKKCRTANTFLASMDCWSHWTANKLKCVKLIFGHCVVRIVDMSIWLLNPKIYSRTHTPININSNAYCLVSFRSFVWLVFYVSHTKGKLWPTTKTKAPNNEMSKGTATTATL